MSKQKKQLSKVVDEELSSDSDSDQIVQIKTVSKKVEKTSNPVNQSKGLKSKPTKVESEEESSDEEEIKLLSKKTSKIPIKQEITKSAKEIIAS